MKNRRIVPMSPESTAIAKRWPTPKAFYAERDHRTCLEIGDLATYAERPVEVHVAPQVVSSITLQRMAIIAANLMARWARNVKIVAPDAPLYPPLCREGHDTLHARLHSEMMGADPFGHFVVTTTSDTKEGALRLFIGPWSNPAIPFTEEDFIISASSWSAVGQRGVSPPWQVEHSATAPAAALAAALGVADVFKRAVGHPKRDWIQDFSWSTWSHAFDRNPPHTPSEVGIPASLDLGNLLLAGVGAIGSAILYILATMPIAGRLTLLDHDTVNPSNLNRSPLFNVNHAINGQKKVEACAEYMAPYGIDMDVVSGTWHEHALSLSKRAYDVWISLTNEDGAWAEMPFQMPPIVLHGTTTSGWGLGFGRHIPRLEDCTRCRMPHPEAVFRGPCAEGEIDTSEDELPIRASLPFLSVAAAALVVAELQKLHYRELPTLPNMAAADLRKGLPTIIAATLLSNDDCPGCRANSGPIWEKYGGRGRYFYHSHSLRFELQKFRTQQ